MSKKDIKDFLYDHCYESDDALIDYIYGRVKDKQDLLKNFHEYVFKFMTLK